MRVGVVSTTGGARDVAAAVTGCIVDYQVDSEIHDGVSYIGDEIRNVTGDGQSHAYSIAAGRTATHNARLYNEGNATQRLGLTDGGDDARWIVEYVDVATGQDITADLTGTGCFTTAMAAELYRLHPVRSRIISRMKENTLKNVRGSGRTYASNTAHDHEL